MTLLILIAAAAALLASLFSALTWAAARRAGAASPELTARLARLEAAADKVAPAVREEVRALREELRGVLEANDRTQEARFSGFRHETAESRRIQKEALDEVGASLKALLESNEKRQEAIREALNTNLDQLRNENEAKLEQMRLTVDEKLHATLEQRLGESFKIVSDGLNRVHQGLGEMQTLATGVGDLKRVLTNVKSRGGWAEVQLGQLLEDMLTREQYVKNARIRPDGGEVVEYAVKMPGQSDNAPCLLPIDAKFPNEGYERLLLAQERAVPEEIEACAQALERAVRTEAQRIRDKYIHPPASTDFAIMYLPTEGLFAEAIRRPGLVADLQQRFRVTVTGPTTLAAFLTSLQMGFRTLAIQKRSSEVWQVLGAAKAEFRKYGEVWDKLGKKLDEAKRTVDQAGVRTRALERTLRHVEAVEGVEAPAHLLALPPAEEEEAA